MEKNLVPEEKKPKKMKKIPGPGASGFVYIKQESLVSQEGIEGKRERSVLFLQELLS